MYRAIHVRTAGGSLDARRGLCDAGDVLARHFRDEIDEPYAVDRLLALARQLNHVAFSARFGEL